jgi:tetratricopeptide (TPR) repeat protein
MRSLNLITKQRNKESGSMNAEMQKAISFQKNGQHSQAILIFEKILKKESKNYLARLHLGLTYLLSNNPLPASKILHYLHEDYPNDLDVLRLVANAYTKLGQFSLAIRFLKRVIKIEPEDFETWLNLTSAAACSQQNTDALYYATQAISIQPTDARAHLNLGGALSSAGRFDDALYCFETVLKLEPNNIAALSNCALIFDKKGDSDTALRYLSHCAKLVAPESQQEQEIFYKMSYPFLSKGNLEQGWSMYEHGFKPNNVLSRGPKRTFTVPKWEGQSIHGKRLLVWREQGLGDELMFFHTLQEVFALCDDLIIECESRLVSLFKRSFPKCLVREQQFEPLTGLSNNNDFDYHIAVGSLLQIFRTDISNFSRNLPYLIPDPNLVKIFSERLKKFKPKKIVGICWRSGSVSVERNIHYAPLSSWKPIFDVKDIVFVNLQYGDCNDEIQDAHLQMGVEIINWPDLDLRNDLESVAALIANLDCVVSVGTAVAQMTGALGTPLKLLVSRDWVLLGQDQYPWFSNTELFASEILQPVEPLIPHLSKGLENFLQK